MGPRKRLDLQDLKSKMDHPATGRVGGGGGGAYSTPAV